jgi:hypothetical protein
MMISVIRWFSVYVQTRMTGIWYFGCCTKHNKYYIYNFYTGPFNHTDAMQREYMHTRWFCVAYGAAEYLAEMLSTYSVGSTNLSRGQQNNPIEQNSQRFTLSFEYEDSAHGSCVCSQVYIINIFLSFRNWHKIWSLNSKNSRI